MRTATNAAAGKKRIPWPKIGFALMWIGLFAFVAWPSLKTTRANQTRIRDLSDRIESLGEWAEGGLMSAELTGSWESELSDQYDQRFPRERDLRGIYFELAEASRRSGVDPIHVEPARNAALSRADRRRYEEDEDLEYELEEMLDLLGLDYEDIPSSRLKPHLLRVHFETNYNSLTRFVEALAATPRALSVVRVDLGRSGSEIAVDMELEYYVQEAN